MWSGPGSRLHSQSCPLSRVSPLFLQVGFRDSREPLAASFKQNVMREGKSYAEVAYGRHCQPMPPPTAKLFMGGAENKAWRLGGEGGVWAWPSASGAWDHTRAPKPGARCRDALPAAVDRHQTENACPSHAPLADENAPVEAGMPNHRVPGKAQAFAGPSWAPSDRDAVVPPPNPSTIWPAELASWSPGGGR